MIRRRMLMLFPFLGGILLGKNASTSPVSFDGRSFDARDWARAFADHVRHNPSIATDEGTLVAWFATAIMLGYDEAHYRIDQSRKDVSSVREAVARGWCAPKNSAKVMDTDLADAIVNEIMQLRVC